MNINRPKRLVCAATLLMMAAMTGCTFITSTGADMQETITQEEAEEKVTEHIDNAVAALPEEAELETRRGMKAGSCDDPTDGGSQDRVTVSERLWVRGLPVEDNEQNVEILHDHWMETGYRVLFDKRPEELSLSVEHEEDSFRMSIRTSDKGSLSLAASSPCVWPEGTPGS